MESRPKPFHITFLRHGESVGNAQSRWQGQAEFPLTDIGRNQAQALAERWQNENKKFDYVISSPLERAKETAQIVADALGLPVQIDSLWLERHNGEFSGLTAHEVKTNFVQPNFRTPYDAVGGDGEGDWELFLRAGQALHGLLMREPARYLVVSHGGLLNQILHAIVGIGPQAHNSGTRFSFGNTAFAQLIYYPHQHRWVIKSVNDHAHWQDADE